MVVYSSLTTLDLAGRAAALVLTVALTANTLLVAVSPRNSVFEYIIVVLSSITSILMLTRLMWPEARPTKFVPLMSAGVWGLTFLNIAFAYRTVAWQVKLRQGGFFLAFFLASLSLYYVSKLHIERRDEEVAVPSSD